MNDFMNTERDISKLPEERLREIEAFKENLVTPQYDRSERAFGNINYKLQWLQFCVTMGKFFGKFTGAGMFKPVARVMALRDSLKNLESPAKNN